VRTGHLRAREPPKTASHPCPPRHLPHDLSRIPVVA